LYYLHASVHATDANHPEQRFLSRLANLIGLALLCFLYTFTRFNARHWC